MQEESGLGGEVRAALTAGHRKTLNPTQAILLDAAGTLIEPAEPVSAVYARHFESAGFPLDERLIRGAFGQVFRTLPQPDYGRHADGDLAELAWWRDVVRETVRGCGVIPSRQAFEPLFAGIFKHYSDGSAWRVFPEAIGMLQSLKASGFRLAVVSNFDRRLHRILEDLELAPLFETVITSSDARSRKPHPGIFMLALETLGLGPSKVVHIGDSADADLAGAGNAGIRAFLLDRPQVTLSAAWDWIRDGFVAK